MVYQKVKCPFCGSENVGLSARQKREPSVMYATMRNVLTGHFNSNISITRVSRERMSESSKWQ